MNQSAEPAPAAKRTAWVSMSSRAKDRDMAVLVKDRDEYVCAWRPIRRVEWDGTALDNRQPQASTAALSTHKVD